MRRRDFVTLLSSAAAWPFAARAQQSGKIPKVGFLFPGTETVGPLRIAAFVEGLQAVGYRVPDQVELVARVTGGDPSRVAPMASELVERNVDVVVASSPAAVQAIRLLTSTMPIVAFDLETDPVGSGLVKSLARPGGNITGVFFDFPEFSKKWLEGLQSLRTVWAPLALRTPRVSAAMGRMSQRIKPSITYWRANTELTGARATSGPRETRVAQCVRGPYVMFVSEFDQASTSCLAWSFASPYRS